MADVQGVAGELIARLISAVNSSEGLDWFELGFYMEFALGGDELEGIDPDTGKEPTPESIGAKRRETHQVVSRDEYFSRMAARLAGLVRSGVREDFLVRAVRDELTSRVHSYARTEEGTTGREALREKMEEHARDPEYIVAFRKSLAAKDPTAANLDDKALADRLRKMAQHAMTSEVLTWPAVAWEFAARWNERSQAISDQVLETWIAMRSVIESRGHDDN